MAVGTIKTTNLERGFGFIETAVAGADVFFHCSALESLDFDERLRGRRVQFEMGVDPRTEKSRAVSVRPAN